MNHGWIIEGLGVLVHDRLDARWLTRDGLLFSGGQLVAGSPRDMDQASAMAIEALVARDVRADLEASTRRHEAAVREHERREREQRGELTNVDRAARWLARAEPAIAGACGKGWMCNSYNRRAFSVAASVGRGFDLSYDETCALLREWNRTCAPPMPPKVLEKLVADALKRGRVPRGARLDRRAA